MVVATAGRPEAAASSNKPKLARSKLETVAPTNNQLEATPTGGIASNTNDEPMVPNVPSNENQHAWQSAKPMKVTYKQAAKVCQSSDSPMKLSRCNGKKSAIMAAPNINAQAVNATLGMSIGRRFT